MEDRKKKTETENYIKSISFLVYLFFLCGGGSLAFSKSYI